MVCFVAGAVEIAGILQVIQNHGISFRRLELCRGEMFNESVEYKDRLEYCMYPSKCSK